MLLSKLQEVSAEIDCKIPYGRTMLHVLVKIVVKIVAPESRQSESHYKKSKTRCLEVQVLNQCP